MSIVKKNNIIYTSSDITEPQSLLTRPKKYTMYSLPTLQNMFYKKNSTTPTLDIEWITMCLKKDRIQDRSNDEDILQYSEYRIKKEQEIEKEQEKEIQDAVSITSLLHSPSSTLLHSLQHIPSTTSLHSITSSSSTTSLQSLNSSLVKKSKPVHKRAWK